MSRGYYRVEMRARYEIEVLATDIDDAATTAAVLASLNVPDLYDIDVVDVEDFSVSGGAQ